MISIVKKIYKAKIKELKLKEEKDTTKDFLTSNKIRAKNKNKKFNIKITSKIKKKKKLLNHLIIKILMN